MAGLYTPLPTLRRRPRGRLRTDRGRRGLLLLHRSGLSPHTPCQSPGALTRVAACTLALSPIRDTLIEGFSHFVASMTAPIASGWSESPGGTCTHWKAPPCHGARGNRTFRCQRRCRQIGFGHDSARVLFQGGVQATSLIQINGPACRRSRRSSSLRTEEIAENLSLYMHKFGKYSVILGNIECHFRLFGHLLRHANRRTT